MDSRLRGNDETGAGSRKPPRWTIAFLHALERLGEARAAADDAGVDHSTAYARRKAHRDFAEAWAEALRGHRAAKARAEAEEIAQFTPPPPSAVPLPTGSAGGEELTVSGGQVKRVGPGRWSKAKEKAFFDELAATKNIRRAAKAAGVSYNAVHERRRKHRLFAAKWAAVAASAGEAIHMYLLEASQQTFDPDALDTAGVTPKVTIAEAIRIVQLEGSKAQREAQERSLAEQAEQMTAEQYAELRERILRRVLRLRERLMAEKLAEGWSLDESHGLIVPPGWVRDGGPEPREAG